VLCARKKMEPSKAPPQARPIPQDRPFPTMIGRMTPQDHDSPHTMFHSPMSSTTKQGAVRYVTVAIPADLQPTAENMARYFNPSFKPSESPMTVMTTGSNSVAPASSSSSKSKSFHPAQSSYGFVPISHETPRESRPFSPPLSPYTYGQTSPSPSMMSTMTTETFTSGKGLDRMSPAFFPAVYRPPTPQALTPASTSTPASASASASAVRPRTPTGRKSPFVKSSSNGMNSPIFGGSSSSSTTNNNNNNNNNNTDADDSVRKSRIKTEMCMHYSNNRPCPFGVNCTYAHGEEELQMTKLLDLHHAGLVDVDTYRTKPCLTWVATGSWYVIFLCALCVVCMLCVVLCVLCAVCCVRVAMRCVLICFIPVTSFFFCARAHVYSYPNIDRSYC
jgi:hypothetical protein